MSRHGAFLPGPALHLEPTGSGPLDGVTFATKDLFDIAGHVTGCGTPDWAATHAPAASTAWAVTRLRDAGAAMRGKTVTDEISLGLLGSNRHFGTPVNPIAPDRFPGGSSSGSAVAVAAGAVDCALGSDTGGSVRVPASFLGLYGLRPTHGAIPVDGLMAQAPSFDTVGFFARDPGLFATVGACLLPAGAAHGLDNVLVAEDALACCDPAVREAAAPAIERLARGFGRRRTGPLAQEGLAAWKAHHLQLQPVEFAATFRPWVEATNPRLSFEVARSLTLAGLVSPAENAAARMFRAELRARVDAMLGTDTVICLPTTPILPPRLTPALPIMAAADDRIITLACIAGLTGLPQVNLPLARAGELPVGISLIGPRGSDRALLALAQRFAALAA